MTSLASQKDIAITDRRWMRAAIGESLRAQGRTGSNPPVGCVIIDKAGQLCASAHTGLGGRPHAETEALKLAGISANGGTAYVTLEPCSHHGKTPPCTTAIIKSKISRVVLAAGDPDARVNGHGIKTLVDAGIEVVTHVENADAICVMAGFLNRLTHGRPYVSLKVAASLDGRIALADKQKRWLTGSPMRRFVHDLRSRNDALITGVGTMIADDPVFTCREHASETDSPEVYILDSSLRTPATARIFNFRQRPVTIFCTELALQNRYDELRKVGANIVTLPVGVEGNVDIVSVFGYLGTAGINNIVVESGTKVATTLYKHDLVDQIFWTQSSHILGGDALPALGALNLLMLSPQKSYIQKKVVMIGNDFLHVFVKPIGKIERK